MVSPEHKETSVWWWLIVMAILCAVLMIFSSVVTVGPTERLVITRFGAFSQVDGPGLHWTIPLVDQRTLVDVSAVQSVADSALLQTQDGSVVKAEVTLNYRVVDPQAYLFYGSVPTLLQKQLAAANLQVFSKQNAVTLLSVNAWPDLPALIQTALPDLSAYGIKVQGVVVSNVSVPDALSAQLIRSF